MINLINIILPHSYLLKFQCSPIKGHFSMLYSTDNYRSSSTSSMALNATLSTKLILTVSMNTNFGLALKSNACQITLMWILQIL